MILDWLVAPAERKSGFADEIYQWLTASATSKSGQSVTHMRALRVSTVLACCRVLAEGIAQVPLKLYQQTGKQKRIATEKKVHRILHRAPNSWMTSFEFRETMMYHAILARGGFAVKNIVRGEVVELLPVTPDRVTVVYDGGEVGYRIRIGAVIEEFSRDQVFHLRGPSWDGVSGMEAIDYAREAIGLAMATEETHAKLHANGARPGGILSIQGTLSDPSRHALKKAWEDSFSGSNAFRTAVLDGGAKWEQMAMTGVDSQHLETRKHQVEEICRTIRVFPQMVGYSDKTSTYASAEQFFIAHVVHSLGPWFERWEQVIDRDMLTEREREEGFFAKFSVQGLLRGDAKSRAEFYKSGILTGWMVRNEARELEDLDPIDGLDEPLVPMNMADSTNKEEGKPDE